ncbi:hypothetical protein SBRCBS47491_009041 [Sporothrix bragantina]|uniref:AB hydrolase-1 domain-containing protein n=1 Tax=Sporothrix bragantina TaxID=671064 RepID=A0ABP0CUR4_9PEZI
MDGFSKKTLVTKRSLKYTYYVSPEGEASEKHPALLFLHGFPDSAHLWTDVIAALGPVPNKIIVPDCLGYAGTDKPEDMAMYVYDGQAADLQDILEAETIPTGPKTVVIGHDWGSVLAQRLYLHHRSLFKGVVLVNTGYIVPSSDKFDLEAANSFTEKLLGYPQLAYWELFTASDAADIINPRLEQMWLALHADRPHWMKEMFCVKGAMRDFLLEGDKSLPLKSYATGPKHRQHFLDQFSQANGGFEGALQMYKTTANNMQGNAFAKLPPMDLTINVPVLYIICTDDAVCRPELMMDPAKAKGLVPKVRDVVLDCGHWSPMEKPNDIAAELRVFLEKDV